MDGRESERVAQKDARLTPAAAFRKFLSSLRGRLQSLIFLLSRVPILTRPVIFPLMHTRVARACVCARARECTRNFLRLQACVVQCLCVNVYFSCLRVRASSRIGDR